MLFTPPLQPPQTTEPEVGDPKARWQRAAAEVSKPLYCVFDFFVSWALDVVVIYWFGPLLAPSDEI